MQSNDEHDTATIKFNAAMVGFNMRIIHSIENKAARMGMIRDLIRSLISSSNPSSRCFYFIDRLVSWGRVRPSEEQFVNAIKSIVVFREAQILTAVGTTSFGDRAMMAIKSSIDKFGSSEYLKGFLDSMNDLLGNVDDYLSELDDNFTAGMKRIGKDAKDFDFGDFGERDMGMICLLYTSPSPRD